MGQEETDSQSSATGHDACKISGPLEDLCDNKYQTNDSPSVICDKGGTNEQWERNP